MTNKLIKDYKIIFVEKLNINGINAGALKTYDATGNIKTQKMFRLKIEYGYRLIFPSVRGYLIRSYLLKTEIPYVYRCVYIPI